ncbi:hypothetical protein K9M79_02875 [Candidatus Woesearchaeota archaeon]|nr:hypothetical protein [Candidatus Woesearchaeota archaeon]
MAPTSQSTILNRSVYNGSLQVAAAGDTTANLDVTPASGDQILYSMRVIAPLADTDSTLEIWKDSAIAGNLIFDGYLANRDANGDIKFPLGETCTTKWIVKVTSTTASDVFALAMHE